MSSNIINNGSSEDSFQSMSRKYSQHYVENVLRYKSDGEVSPTIKTNARNMYNLHGEENERMLENIVRQVAFDGRVDRQEFIDPDSGFTAGNYYHVKVKPEYQDKDTPNYY